MALELRQTQKLSQQLVMTPQLQQAIRLLQLSRLELADAVREEIEQNPMLEEGEETTPIRELSPGEGSLEADTSPPKTLPEPTRTEEVRPGDGKGVDIDWDQYLENYQTLGHTAPNGHERPEDELPSLESRLTRDIGLFDHLATQLADARLSEEERRAAYVILGNLDDDGYLRIEDFPGDPLEHVAAEAGVDQDTAARALAVVQKLDPAGVAARNLPECLLLQLKARRLRHPLAAAIIRDHLDLLAARKLKALARALDTSVEAVDEAARFIASLEPRPGRNYTGEAAPYITPDVYIVKLGGEWRSVLNDDGLTKLKICQAYRGLATADTDTRKFVQDKMQSAVWFIRSIHQRQRTIQKVTDSVIKFQREFLEDGVSRLRPLVLRDVAEDIGMHESTVSRATTAKYVHTPQGIFELKWFFKTSIATTAGDEVSSEAVRDELKKAVAQENPAAPFSDQKLAELLEERGISIARRTVAKYREALGILPSSQRKSYILSSPTL